MAKHKKKNNSVHKPIVFEVNNDVWTVEWVKHDDPRLQQEDGTQTYGVTYCCSFQILISDICMNDKFLLNTITHEVAHAYYYSLGRSVRGTGEFTEEDFCEMIAHFARQIVLTADDVCDEMLEQDIRKVKGKMTVKALENAYKQELRELGDSDEDIPWE